MIKLIIDFTNITLLNKLLKLFSNTFTMTSRVVPNQSDERDHTIITINENSIQVNNITIEHRNVRRGWCDNLFHGNLCENIVILTITILIFINLITTILLALDSNKSMLNQYIYNAIMIITSVQCICSNCCGLCNLFSNDYKTICIYYACMILTITYNLTYYLHYNVEYKEDFNDTTQLKIFSIIHLTNIISNYLLFAVLFVSKCIYEIRDSNSSFRPIPRETIVRYNSIVPNDINTIVNPIQQLDIYNNYRVRNYKTIDISNTKYLSDKSCCICRIDFINDENNDENNKIIKLHCEHLYHKNCIDTWLQSHNNCPLCRKIVVH